MPCRISITQPHLQDSRTGVFVPFPFVPCRVTWSPLSVLPLPAVSVCVCVCVTKQSPYQEHLLLPCCVQHRRAHCAGQCSTVLTILPPEVGCL